MTKAEKETKIKRLIKRFDRYTQLVNHAKGWMTPYQAIVCALRLVLIATIANELSSQKTID